MIYLSVPDFYAEVNAWLGYTSGKLYFYPLGVGKDAILRINPDTLAVEEELELEGTGAVRYLVSLGVKYCILSLQWTLWDQCVCLVMRKAWDKFWPRKRWVAGIFLLI